MFSCAKVQILCKKFYFFENFLGGGENYFIFAEVIKKIVYICKPNLLLKHRDD